MSPLYERDGPLYERDMERLALGRIQEGREIQRLHRAVDGICVSCGRESPCDEFRQAGEIVARYTSFLETDQDPPQAPNGITRVRPYVLSGAQTLNTGSRWNPARGGTR